jgi:hypothetical protein
MTMRIQYMIQNKTQVETVNFRLYFKIIFRQNEDDQGRRNDKKARGGDAHQRAPL